MSQTPKKLVIVGDGMSGKTSLLIAFVYGGSLDVCTFPTVMEGHAVDFKVDGTQLRLEVFDTSGQEDYDRLRPLTYCDSDVILICFPIDTPDSLENVHEKWISEVKHFSPGTPILLIGCMKDLRQNERSLAMLEKIGKQPVTFQEGKEAAQKIGAEHYLECSSKTGEGIAEVFDYAGRTACRGARRSRQCRKGHCIVL